MGIGEMARWPARSRCRCGLNEEDFRFLIRMSDDGVAVISRVGEQTFRLIFCCQYRMLVGIGEMARWSARSRCRCGLKEEDFSFLSRMSDDGVGAEADLEGRRK